MTTEQKIPESGPAFAVLFDNELGQYTRAYWLDGELKALAIMNREQAKTGTRIAGYLVVLRWKIDGRTVTHEHLLESEGAARAVIDGIGIGIAIALHADEKLEDKRVRVETFSAEERQAFHVELNEGLARLG